MTRAEFLRTLGLGAAGLAGSLAGLTHVSAAPMAETGVDVYPTGIYPYDVDEVTAAVNGGIGPSGRAYPGGGIVHLKATTTTGTPMYFNFGGAYPSANRGSVAVRRDVTIVGEAMPPIPMVFPYDPAPDADYTPDRTVVYGGKRTFACPADAPVAPRLTLVNIFIAHPSLSAIQVRKCAGLEVTDCVIYDIKIDDTGVGFSVATGIEATGLLLTNPDLSGAFRVMNNRIRRASPITYPPAPPFADTAIVMQLSAMAGQIMANALDRFTFLGIGVDRNNGPVTIAGNATTNCGYGARPGAGGIGVQGTTSPILIERNRISGGHGGPSMSLPSKGAVVLSSSNVVLRSNAIEGAFATQGILLTPFTTWFATDNRLEQNDLSGAMAAQAQVMIRAGCDRNRFANNDYGGVSTAAEAGIVVPSADNTFVNEDFWGTYTGTGGQPCVWLTPTSSGNAISALKYQGAPQGFDICTQVLDQGTNAVHGSAKCG
jgi:hypothetical protein